MSEPGTREAGNVAIARTACQPDTHARIPSREIDDREASFAYARGTITSTSDRRRMAPRSGGESQSVRTPRRTGKSVRRRYVECVLSVGTCFFLLLLNSENI